MSATAISICDKAVGWIGGNPVSSITAPYASVEEQLCGQNYESCRDMALEARNWSFALSRSALTPHVTAPDFGYTYAYDLPSDWIRVVEADSDPDFESHDHWVREGDQILTDIATTLYLRYIKRITDPAEFSSHFVHVLSYRIAADIAVPLTGSEPLMKLMEAKYDYFLEQGGALDGMQGKNQPVRTNTLIGVR